MTVSESTTCRKCGKAIAAQATEEALCCRCRYGQLVEKGETREPDAFELMRRHDAKWAHQQAPDSTALCPQCGLEYRTCQCRRSR